MSQRPGDGDARQSFELPTWAGGLDEGAVDADAMFRQVQAEITSTDRGPIWWLRTRPTTVRRAVAIAGFVAVAALGGLLGPRADLGVYPVARMVASLFALGVLGLLSVHQGLRPLHQPASSPRAIWALVGLALLAAFVVNGLPAAHHAHPESLGGTGDALLSRALPCFSFGMGVGLPVYGISRILARGTRLTSLLAASAAGLTGTFALQLHCPLVAPEHAVLGHFTVVVVFVMGAGVISAIETYWHARRS